MKQEAPLPQRPQRVVVKLVYFMTFIGRLRWWLINHFYIMSPESYRIR